MLYFDKIKKILDEVEKKESKTIIETSEAITQCINSKHSIYIFGASHAGILTQEMFYRAGGLINVNPIFARELSLDNEPITLTSKMERLDGYGRVLAYKTDFKKDDILILHSVSGRNPVTIELCLEANKQGVTTIAITNLNYSKTVKSRDKTGKLLYEIADIVIDNHGDIGDASMEISKEIKVSPTSTVIGAAILNQIVYLVGVNLKNSKCSPLPFFYSANIDGGDLKNREVTSFYKDTIHYKF